MSKHYYKDFWNEREVILAKSSTKGLIAVGQVIKEGSEIFIHIKEEDLLDFLRKEGVIK